MKWYGITHPFWFIGDGRLSGLFCRAWARFACARGYHLFDEVWAGNDEHRIVCDACGMEIWLTRVERDYR